MEMKKLCTALLVLLITLGHQNAESKSLDSVIAGDHRSEQNKSRDVYRNPKQTLEFFGIESEMTVVEVWPSAGWYTEILAPYLNEKGQYISASFDLNSDSAFVQRMGLSLIHI